MSALLYISISSKFTDDEIKQIDKQVSKNYETIKSLSKFRVKKILVNSIVIFQLKAAVMMPLPPQISIEHLVPAEVTGKEEAHLLESGGNYLTEAVLNNQKALTITDTNTNDLQ